jgi:diadenosine tetraphosphate (Ap4A) HIT family hydrolase
MTLPLPVVDPCYFCELVHGRSSRWNVIEYADLTLTVLNGRQFEIGQCIVLPVRHAPTLLDLTELEAAAIMAAARRVMNVVIDAFAPDGVLLYQNNGIGSGQEVPHFHLHVVPRRPDSDWGLGPPHLARHVTAGRPEHIDHAAVTDAKRQTVEQLRRHFA